MATLSDTQLTILSAAAQRPDGNLLPLPGSLRGGAAAKVVGALIKHGLVREEVTETSAKTDAALNTLWRNLEDGRGVLLRITAAALEALGLEPDVPQSDEAPQRPGAGDTDSPASAGSLSAAAAEGSSASHTAPLQGKVREGTKQAALVAMLKRVEGATIKAPLRGNAREGTKQAALIAMLRWKAPRSPRWSRRLAGSQTPFAVPTASRSDGCRRTTASAGTSGPATRPVIHDRGDCAGQHVTGARRGPEV